MMTAMLTIVVISIIYIIYKEKGTEIIWIVFESQNGHKQTKLHNNLRG